MKAWNKPISTLKAEKIIEVQCLEVRYVLQHMWYHTGEVCLLPFCHACRLCLPPLPSPWMGNTVIFTWLLYFCSLELMQAVSHHMHCSISSSKYQSNSTLLFTRDSLSKLACFEAPSDNFLIQLLKFSLISHIHPCSCKARSPILHGSISSTFYIQLLRT